MENRKRLRMIGYIFSTLIIGLVALAALAQNAPQIHIVEATYGDKTAGKTCVPNLEICKHSSGCEFTVDDGLCDVDAPVKTLEVIYDCGPGTDFQTRTAAKGTKISLSCGN